MGRLDTLEAMVREILKTNMKARDDDRELTTGVDAFLLCKPMVTCKQGNARYLIAITGKHRQMQKKDTADR